MPSSSSSLPSWQRTDCVERPLSRLMRSLGRLVGSHPLPFLVFPLALAGALGVGFRHVKAREANDLEEQYTPSEGPAKSERRWAQALFPSDDAESFSAERLSTEGSFASLLVLVEGEGGSVLTPAAMAEVLTLDAAVRHSLGAEGARFEDLCARRRPHGNNCSSPNPLLEALEGDPRRIRLLLPNLTFPLAFGGRLPLGPFLGGVSLGEGGAAHPVRPLKAARALRLLYFLQEDHPPSREASRLWLQGFLDGIPEVLRELQLRTIQVTYFTSLSRQKEFEKISKEVIPLISITYFLTIFFSIMSCSRLDCVRTKVWVAAFGVVSSGLAVVSSFGLLMFCGVPFVITAANSPFLILGVGVDDMFIMVSCWQHSKVKDRIRERMADTYAEAAVSVTITTLTDVLAFYIGIGSSFPSVQSFCIYTGTAFVFCYLYNLTFLGAILALNGKREKRNRHWLTFRIVKCEPENSRGHLYNICCVGGSFDESTGAETEHPITEFFRKYYGPFLMQNWTKILVIVVYLLYMGSSIYGCTQVKEGINVRNLAIDKSYVVQYYDWEEEYFSEYGPRIMVIVNESVSYWDPSVRGDIENCMGTFEKSSFIDKHLSDSWLRIYETVATLTNLNINDQRVFITNLPTLNRINPDYESDINYSKTEIFASRFFIQAVNITSAVDEKNLLNELRNLAEECKIPMIVYHPAFIYYDQFVVIVQNTIQNVLIATGAMLFISMMLIPNPLCSLWVTFAIASVIVGVTGFMAFWNVSLDSISMINLVICIGFSVDYSAHISYAFVSSEKPKVNEKAVDALYSLGYPIVQASASTLVGVLVLSMSATYIFRTFFKIMFLVILFGAIHGLIFIPVFLTFFGFCAGLPSKEYKSSDVERSQEVDANMEVPEPPSVSMKK